MKPIELKIKADDQASKRLKSLRDRFSALTTSSKKLNKIQGNTKKQLASINAFERLEKTTSKLRKTFKTNQTQLSALNKRQSSGAKLTAAQTKKLKSLTESIHKNKKAYAASLSGLRQQQQQLKKTGIATKDLAKHQTRLRSVFSKTKAIQAQKQSVGGAAKRIGKRAAIGAGAGLLGLGTGLTAVWRMAKNYASEADELLKTTQRLGVSMPWMQGLQHAGELAGVAASDIRNSFEGFSRRMGEFRSDQGTLYSFLKKNDPVFLKKMKAVEGTDKAAELLFEKIASLKDPNRQAALANMAFGRTGARSLLLAQGGIQGLLDAQKEVSELGLGISEKDANAAAEFNDAIQRTSLLMQSLKSKLFTPLLLEVTKKIQDVITKIKGDDGYLESIFIKINQWGEGIKSLFLGVGWVLEKIGAIGNWISANKTLFKTIAAVGGAVLVFGKVAATIALLATPVGWLALAITGIGATFAAFPELFKEAVASITKIYDRIRSIFGLDTTKAGASTGRPQHLSIAQELRKQGGLGPPGGRIAVDFSNLPQGSKVQTESQGLRFDTGLNYAQ